MNKFEKMFREKLMVVPETVAIKQKRIIKYYNAEGIHMLPEEDKYYPNDRILHLYMPASATVDTSIEINKCKPEKISIKKDDEILDSFRLEPITISKKIKNFDFIDKKILGQYMDLKTENPEREVNIPFDFSLRLPMTENNYILTRSYSYDTVIQSVARDVYKRLYEIQVEVLRKNHRVSDNVNYVPTKDEKRAIDENFTKFIKGIDAIEIGYEPGSNLFLGFSDLEKDVNYEIHSVLLYRFPTNTRAQREIKTAVFETVRERKSEIKTQKQVSDEKVKG